MPTEAEGMNSKRQCGSVIAPNEKQRRRNWAIKYAATDGKAVWEGGFTTEFEARRKLELVTGNAQAAERRKAAFNHHSIYLQAKEVFDLRVLPVETRIYFIRTKSMPLVKIGISKNPDERLWNLSSSCPFDVELVAVAWGDEKTERDLHAVLAPYRFRCEWYLLAQPIQKLIHYLKQRAEFQSPVAIRRPRKSVL